MRQHLLPAVRATLVLAVLTGLVWPLAFTAFAQTVFPRQAAGSLLRNAHGEVIGSALLAQKFTRPGYFHPRPSAAGSDGYDGRASGGTNLGPTSAKLLDGVADLVAAYRRDNSLGASAPVPVDAVTRSASGLDPHISVPNARLQTARVAKARKLSETTVKALVDKLTEPRQFGLLGEARVNVLALNLALDRSTMGK